MQHDDNSIARRLRDSRLRSRTGCQGQGPQGPQYSCPGLVTDTEYRGISKYRYRYRSRYCKYRRIPKKKYRKNDKSVFHFVNTTPRDQSLCPFWRPTQPDWIISTIRLFSNFTQNRYRLFNNPCRNIPALNLLKFLFRPSRFRPVLSTSLLWRNLKFLLTCTLFLC